MPPKRRATSPIRPPASPKRHQTSLPTTSDTTTTNSDQDIPPAERYGIINRTFYPPEIPNSRCAEYNESKRPNPLSTLLKTLASTALARSKIPAGESVVHWFKRDLRIQDNRALHLASTKAQQAGVPLVGVFLVSPQDYEAHNTSPARVDFELRTLEVLKQDLADLGVPLFCETVEERREVPAFLVRKCKEWGARQVFCNIEYEVDELRRETGLVRKCLGEGIAFEAVHDDVVVPPEALTTGLGKRYSVYSPWFKAWLKHLKEHPHLLSPSPSPSPNPPSAQTEFAAIFAAPLPPTPPNKTLPPTDRDRLAHLWPPGETAARARLAHFLCTKARAYKTARSTPSANSTSMLSPHLSLGTLSARTAIRETLTSNPPSQTLATGSPGPTTFIAELAWRDFYKHVLAHWPHVCMHKPFKYEYTRIAWSYSPELFTAWATGHTGYPLVDAAMRQLLHTAHMHNRCRMLTASFLAKHLLLDWRLGERHFLLHLIDGDFSSNSGGWGFSASSGVDPQPFFRIFNPILQSEKFDPAGEYIRKWVPELAGVEGGAVHDPYGRGAGEVARRGGYPRMVVGHAEARERCLRVYREGLGRGTANVGGGVHN